MKDNKFENQYKKTLEEYEGDLNVAHFWDELEPKLPKKEKRKRRLIFWFFLGFGLLSFGGLLYQTIFSTEWNGSTKEEIVDSQINKNRAAANHITPDSKKERDNYLDIEEKIQRTRTAAAQSPSKTQNKKNTSSNQGASIQNKKVTKETFDHEQLKTSTNKIITDPIIVFEPKSEPNKEENLDPSKAADRNTKKKKAKKKKTKKKKRNKKVRVRKRKKKWTPVFYGWAGTSLAFHSYKSSTIEPSYKSLIELRKEKTKKIGTYSFGGSFNLIHRDGFLWTMGLNARRHSEIFEIQETQEEFITLEDEVIKEVLDASGNIIRLEKGDITATKIREVKYKQYTSYNTLNIPIGIGYQALSRSGQFHQILGGIEWTPVFLTTGNILEDTNLHLAPLKEISRSTGIGLWAEYKFGRKWNKEYGWYIAPAVKYNLAPFTKQEVNISEKLNYIGLRFGIYYKKK